MSSKTSNEFDVDEFLAHHGIEGMHWGVKNGPPYPLDRSKGSIESRKHLVRSKDKKAVAKRAASLTDEELKTANNRAAAESLYIKNNYSPGAKDFVSQKMKKYGDMMIDKLVGKAEEELAKVIINKAIDSIQSEKKKDKKAG